MELPGSHGKKGNYQYITHTLGKERTYKFLKGGQPLLNIAILLIIIILL